MGSKRKYAKYILPIVLKNRKENQYYIEPFVGGCNIIERVVGKRIGIDINFYLIEMFKALQNGWIPPDTLSEQEYLDIRDNKDKYNPALVGFVGFGCTYSGKWFGGFARSKDKFGNSRNHCMESKKNILKQVPNIKGISFYSAEYDDYNFPYKSIIYCDPPYKNTTRYKNKFDHEKFWLWCDNMVNDGHKVFVSEYEAPPSWKCLWAKEVYTSLTADITKKKNIERLFSRN